MKNLIIFLIISIKAIYNYNESILLEDLYIPINVTYMKDLISNLTSIIEGYVYLDIAKNPPNLLHKKIDLKEELINKINISNERPFYEFYRDIKRVLSTVRDINLMPKPLINNFSKYMACLPFSFYIEADEENDYQLYMKKNYKCPFNYTNSTINDFIDDAIYNKRKISLINNINPFDFIQNFGKDFLKIKNEHSYFTLIMKYISNFPLYIFPLNEDELNLTINLSNKEEKNISFFIYLNSDLEKNNNDIDDIKLKWDYSIDGFRCRIDEINKFNVFYQNTFYFEDEQKIKDIIFNCSRLFHNNTYSIIGIESRNEIGMDKIGIYLEQLLQPKISTNKLLFSMRKSSLLKDNFEQFKTEYLDFSTCKEPKSYETFFLENPDNYGNITHYRTILLDGISLETKKDLLSKREELTKKNMKKPTEILIFTDYASFNAASVFIKGLQQSGGAIIVGYFGNPKNRKILGDSSISSSGIINYKWTNYSKNLKYLGFEIKITGKEFYDFNFQKDNPLPLEYISISVDEHIDIYQDYSDNIYDKFINESKKIFEKYKFQCNINNSFLLLENNNCSKIKGDSHAHGGFACGNDGLWNKSKCKAFYCDLGFYYDSYQNKCIEDICTIEEDELIPFWAISIIVGGGIIVLFIALFLIRRTVNIGRKSLDEFDMSNKEKFVE